MKTLLTHTWRRLGRLSVCLGLAALVGACSMATVAYNRAPTLMYWRIDGIFDLNGEQSALLRPALETWHQWHRAEHLPRYAEELRRWQALSLSDVQPEQVCGALDQVRAWVGEAVDRLMPALADLAPTLSPAQMDHWTRHQNKQNDEFGVEFVSTAGTVSDERFRRAVDRAEMFYGRLTAEQRDWLRTRLSSGAFDPQRVLVERQARHADALSAVQRIQAGAPSEDTLRAVWEGIQRSPRADYRAYSTVAIRDACTQLAELHNRTSVEQRQRALQRLQAFERDVLSLAGIAADAALRP